MIKVAIVGSQGVPATYGGFESLVENLLGKNCPDDISYTVFCSGLDMPDKRPEHKGGKLKYIPLHANGIQSVPYDIMSLCRCLKGYDVILLLGVSGCLFLPLFRLINHTKLIINIDGQEYKRDKWGKLARRILKTSESLAVKFADTVIADNKGIQDYVTETYNRPSTLIAYGGDHVKRTLPPGFDKTVLSKHGIKQGDYAVSVCRIEPENNSETVLEAFSRTDRTLVYIGNWNKSEYGQNLRKKYSKFPNLKLLDAIYDLDVLYAIRSNARMYVHGHSAGGTNPSLVEAMFFGIPILAYDVVYNRETTEHQAYYFNNAENLIKEIERTDLDGTSMKEIAERRYRWKNISDEYTALFRN
ncbi:MAG: DUF1972 domain-containing protein [Muribaculaceae bacterium]|nr:DUF1972 domain-containing protein [Muribaculaceae bacterium]